MTDEKRRLAALHEYRLLDAPADDELVALVRVAAAVAGVPNGTLNLIDERRQCQLTTVGFDGADGAREDSMCAQHFESGEFVVVPDASGDPRFTASPWVDGRLADVRFYASMPLVTAEGHALGTLCVFDDRPGSLTAAQGNLLRDLASVVLGLFERRRQSRLNAHLAAQAEEQLALTDLALRELEVRQEFTDAVMDTIDVGIVAADERGQLSMFNRAARDWHGLDADSRVRPEQLAEHYHLFDTDGVTRLDAEQVPLRRAQVDGKVSGVELVIAPPDRPALTAVCSGRALVDRDGAQIGAVVAMTDVTADRKHQGALEAALTRLGERESELAATVTELQRSNADLEHFAGVASHDLNSPLTVIAGYLELVQDLYGESLGKQGNQWLTTSLTAVSRMQGLIAALLSYARAGSVSCRENVDTEALAAQAVEDLSSAVAEASAEVSVSGLPRVTADPTLLRQLFQNLIGNAVKYRHPDRPSRVQVTATASGDTWVFAVSDNGQGIAEQDRDRVFDMFTRADGVTPTGQGIGLATCSRIVARHGGTIWVAERDGGGAVVRFTLPRTGTPD